MKEPHGKGQATHPGLESCAGHGNMAGEALTRAHAGQPLSSEITSIGVPTLCCEGEGHATAGVYRQPAADAAESETLGMHGNSQHGNRETRETPTLRDGGGRSEKAQGRASDAHVFRESDGFIVPQKRMNKTGPKAVAESVEGRESAKGNVPRALLAPDTAPGKRGMGLRGVREV